MQLAGVPGGVILVPHHPWLAVFLDLHWTDLLEGLLMATGLLLEVLLEMALETSVLVVLYIPGMKAGFLGIDRIIWKMT